MTAANLATAVYIGLGSNLGDRRAQLLAARTALATTAGLRLMAASALYETEPIGGPAEQGPFLNAVLHLHSALSPRQLLHCCLALETRLGRQRGEPWGPRTIDLDLLLFGATVIAEPELVLPHPRLHQRRFVLDPLCDLAPALVHPVLGVTLQQLAHELGTTQVVHRLTESW